VTPGYTAGIVEVKLFSANNGCHVNVSYDMTALSLEGEAALDGYRGAAFANMLVEWQKLITAAVGSDQLEPA
jgi:hypothetical protein